MSVSSASSVSQPIAAVTLKAPLHESKAEWPAPTSSSGDGVTLSIEKDKSDSKPGFWEKVRDLFSSKDPETETSKESALTGFFNRVFKTKDESGKEISRFASWQASISKFFKGSEGPRLSRFK